MSGGRRLDAAHMPLWPYFMPDRRRTYAVPPDLRPRLEAVLSYRSAGAANVWADVRDWLVAYDVAVPDGLRLEPEADASPQRFLATPPRD